MLLPIIGAVAVGGWWYQRNHPEAFDAGVQAVKSKAKSLLHLTTQKPLSLPGSAPVKQGPGTTLDSIQYDIPLKPNEQIAANVASNIAPGIMVSNHPRLSLVKF